MLPPDVTCQSIESNDQSVLRRHEQCALVFNQLGGRMLVAETCIGCPEQCVGLEVDGDDGILHRLGVEDSIFHAQRLAYFPTVGTHADCAGVGVQCGEIAVGRNDIYAFAVGARCDGCRRELAVCLAVVPTPQEFAFAFVEGVEIAVPRTDVEVVLIYERLGDAVVAETAIRPYGYTVQQLEGVEATVRTTDIDCCAVDGH